MGFPRCIGPVYCVLNSKGKREDCIYNRQWELNSEYKGWLTAFKADRKRPSANAAIE